MEAVELLCEDLPAVAERALRVGPGDPADLERHIATVEDQVALRGALAERGLVAWVGDGARLPRRSGVSQLPLTEGAVPFTSPATLAVELEAPHAGRLRGLGVPRGVTLIVGGGYHGKSTLLAALSRGVYDHIPGDGRQLVVTDPTAVKVRAEDGRRVERVDISSWLVEQRSPQMAATSAAAAHTARHGRPEAPGHRLDTRTPSSDPDPCTGRSARSSIPGFRHVCSSLPPVPASRGAPLRGGSVGAEASLEGSPTRTRASSKWVRKVDEQIWGELRERGRVAAAM